jgi:hypothetical protein
VVVLFVCGCGEDAKYFPDTDSGTDVDSDSDSDSDTDGDTDACDGVTCQDPPDDECQTDGTMHDYDQETDGLCVEGECVYEYTTVTCEWGTCAYDDDDLAYCTSPCDDFDCPVPDDECFSDTVIILYDSECYVDEDTGEPLCTDISDSGTPCSYFGEDYICEVTDGDDICVEP